MAEVASAAGFASIRAFNDTVREVFALSPTELRAPRREAGRPARARPGRASRLRLPFRAPLCPDNLFGHLAATAVPGVEEWRDGAYRRTLRLPRGHGVVALRPAPDHIACQLRLTDLRDLGVAIARCRRLLDLDADPVAVDDAPAPPTRCSRRWSRRPPDAGCRAPSTRPSWRSAPCSASRCRPPPPAPTPRASSLAHGEPVDDPDGGLTHLFPEPAALAGMDPADARGCRRPAARRSPGWPAPSPPASSTSTPAPTGQAARAGLAALPGIGPWTVEVVAMRALGDPDAFLPTDLGVRLAAQQLGLPGTPAALTARSAAWRPWRAYAVQHLWATGEHAVNRLPA